MSEFKNQMQLFKAIWKERAHFSQVYEDGEEAEAIFFDPYCFAHVLPKGPYPAFKLLRLNIVLMTPAQHDIFDKQTDKAKTMPCFNWVFELKEALGQLYYRADRFAFATDAVQFEEMEGSVYWKNIQKLYKNNLIEL